MAEGAARKVRAQDECEIFYRLYTNPGKPRLALVHSLGLDAIIWDDVVREMASEAEILAVDCRGHGRSEKRPGTYTAELFARDLAATFDDAGWDAAVVAGCSMGGCVAQAFGAAFPERTLGLGLVDTTCWYGPNPKEEWAKRAAAAAENGFAKMLDFQFSRWYGDAYRTSHPQRITAIAQVFLANDLACYQASCGLLGSVDLRNAIRELRMPVAVIVGEEDYATPPDMARAIHEAIPGSSLTILPGGRHLTPVEVPEKIAGLLRDVMQRSAMAMGG